jgi:hypothetical protein
MRDTIDAIAQIRRQCVSALARGLHHARPGIVLDARGYAEKPEDNLVPGVQLSDFESDLSAGAGAELKGKFLAAHSSAALAVNAFGPLRHEGCPFDLGRHKGLQVVGFEQTFPTGVPRAMPPHLDVIAEGLSGLVAIESKCTEYLTSKPAQFSERYETAITDERASGPWYAEMLRLKGAGGVGYQFLDTAQLIKHAFGLAHHQNGRVTNLVYLYWEPLDAGQSPVFAGHRAEIAAFTQRVAGGNPSFESMSYGELWAAWAASGNVRLITHARNLWSRYAVAALAAEDSAQADGPAGA